MVKDSWYWFPLDDKFLCFPEAYSGIQNGNGKCDEDGFKTAIFNHFISGNYTRHKLFWIGFGVYKKQQLSDIWEHNVKPVLNGLLKGLESFNNVDLLCY